MECYELLKAIEDGRNDEEVIEAVIDYIYDFDSFADLGIMYDDCGNTIPEVYDRYREEAIFRLTDGRKTFLSDLYWDLGDYYAQMDCDIPYCDDYECNAGYAQQDVIDMYRRER